MTVKRGVEFSELAVNYMFPAIFGVMPLIG